MNSLISSHSLLTPPTAFSLLPADLHGNVIIAAALSPLLTSKISKRELSEPKIDVLKLLRLEPHDGFTTYCPNPLPASTKSTSTKATRGAPPPAAALPKLLYYKHALSASLPATILLVHQHTLPSDRQAAAEASSGSSRRSVNDLFAPQTNAPSPAMNLAPENNTVSCLAFSTSSTPPPPPHPASPPSNYLASGSNNGTVHIYDLPPSPQLLTSPPDTSIAPTFILAPHAPTDAKSGAGHQHGNAGATTPAVKCIAWSSPIQSDTPGGGAPPHPNPPTTTTTTKTGFTQHLLVGNADGGIRLWTLVRHSTLTDVKVAKAPSVNWFSSAQATPTSTSTNSAHTTCTYQSLFLSKSLHSSTSSISFLPPPYENLFAATYSCGSLLLFDVRLPSKTIVKINVSPYTTSCQAWAAGGVVATGGGRDRVVKVWDVSGVLEANYGDNSKQPKLERKGAATSGLSTSAKGGASSHAARAKDVAWMGVNQNSGNSDYSGGGNVGLDMEEGKTLLPTQANSNQNSINGKSLGSTGSFSRTTFVVPGTPAVRETSPLASPHNTVNSVTNAATVNPNSTSNNSTGSGGSKRRAFAQPGLGGYKTSTSKTSSGEFNAVKHVATLHVGALVTSIQFRPGRKGRHLVVATSSGASNLGVDETGVVSLWNVERPTMPMVVCDNRGEGGTMMVGFVDALFEEKKKAKSDEKLGLVMPDSPRKRYLQLREREGELVHSPERDYNPALEASYVTSPSARGGVLGGQRPPSPFSLMEAEKVIVGGDIWQHVVSIGKDGNVFLENLAYGKRPTEQVPSSVFGVSNSNFIAAVHQKPPNRAIDDFGLTGLRRGGREEDAIGIFRTLAEDASAAEEQEGEGRWPAQDEYSRRVQVTSIAVSSMDARRSKLDELEPHHKFMKHFAANFVTKWRPPLRSSFEVCVHNAKVCEEVGCGELGRMWRILGSLLETKNAEGSLFHFIAPTAIKSLLQDRVDCGDVQSCVYVCGVLDVFEMKSPPFEIDIVREWYLNYVEQLRSRAMFVEATEVIKYSGDPGGDVGSMSKMGTEIFNSCPSCLKPLINEIGRIEGGGSGGGEESQERILRSCSSCKKKLSMCGLCHDPIKKQTTVCVGCSHGFHIECGNLWFEQEGERVCPTGCGHKCRGEAMSFLPQDMKTSQ